MSGYARALEGFLRLFPKKVKVTLIDAATGKQIGIVKMPGEDLPWEFTKPSFLTVLGKKWRIMKADQMRSEDFLFTHKLVLHVRDSEIKDPADKRFLIPTIAASFPATGENSLFAEFSIDISRDEWRQIEFLPGCHLPEIKETIDSIRAVRSEAKDNGVLLGYHKMHKRRKVEAPDLNLQLDTFCASLEIKSRGSVQFLSHIPGTVTNGFALQTENHLYYGIAENNKVRYLCLQHYECIDSELMEILANFNLVMLDWCERTIISSEISGESSNNIPAAMGDEQVGLF
jgi:hypothetical protein